MLRSLASVGPDPPWVWQGGPIGVRLGSQRLVGVQNAVWMLKKSGSMFGRRDDLR